MPAEPRFPARVPVLTDGIVTLRAHRESDLDAIAEQCQDPDMVRWTTVPSPYERSHAEEFLETVAKARDEGGNRYWAIDAGDDAGATRFAGTVDYRPRDGGLAEVGYGLHPWARGRGVMTRALRLALADAFDSGVEVMHWRAVAGNWGSRRVAWACGFRVEGTVRDLLTGPRGREDGWIASLRAGDPMEPAHAWLVPPVLEGRSVRLRPWRESDAPTVHPDKVGRPMGSAIPTSAGFPGWLTARRTRMAQGEGVFWCVADRDTDEALGHIQCVRLDQGMTAGSGLLGYWLLKGARGRGVMAQALELAVPHAFSPVESGGLGMHRLSAGADVDDLGAMRLLRRAGFTPCANERENHARGDGRVGDTSVFELLATDDREARRVIPLAPTVLETGRLRLRPWRDTDAPGSGEGPDAASLRFMPAGAQPGPDDFPEWLVRRRREMDAGASLHWCIADAATDEMLGNVQVFHLGPTDGRFQGEVGYWLRPGARGRSVIGEALEPVIAQAFVPVADGGLGLTRLHAGTDSDNYASQAALRAAGFTQWGADHQAWRRSDGSLSDGAYFELLASTDRDALRARALKPVTLEGEGIRLRAWRHTDADRVVQACTDPRTRHWLSRMPEPYALPDAADYIAGRATQAAAGAALGWCVADGASDDCVGSIAVFGLDGQDVTSGEIGYWAHPSARGRGVMSEAVRLVVRHAFAPHQDSGLGLRRLELLAADGNTASQQVARRGGFVEVGRDRAAEPLGDGTYADLVRFDLLAMEHSL